MNDEFDSLQLLVKEIKRRPYIWNHRFRKSMSEKVELDKEWQYISVICGLPIEACRKKWIGMRDTYRKIVKRQLATKKPIEEWNVKWYAFHALTFLLEPMIEELSGIENNSTPVTNSTKKQKLNHEPVHVEEKKKPVDNEQRAFHESHWLFLKSLLPSLKLLSDEQKKLLQNKYTTVLLEAFNESLGVEENPAAICISEPSDDDSHQSGPSVTGKSSLEKQDSDKHNSSQSPVIGVSGLQNESDED